jgi:hypothetical protein
MANSGLLALIIVSAVCAGVIAVVVVRWVLRPRCPSCAKATLERDRTSNAGGIELATGGRMYRCTACAAEFRRHHDEGPFIPRAAWDAGARDELPKAHALRKAR